MIRAESLGELFDVAIVLAEQPLPEQRSVAIVTNAGGPGILAADACAAELAVAPLWRRLSRRCARVPAERRRRREPGRHGRGASADSAFARAVRLLAADESVVGGLS